MTNRANRTNSTNRQGVRAFTLVEMLIVIAVIIILLSILIVGLNRARKTAQVTNTRALMNAMKQGITRFKEDIGYLPPVLAPPTSGITGPESWRQLAQPPDVDMHDQNWYSITSLAEYLVGYGSHQQDGYGVVQNVPSNFDWAQETPPTGFRHPGSFGDWGAAGRSICYRMGGNGSCNPSSGWYSELAATNIDQGQVYGPYIELDNPRILGSLALTDNDEVKIVFPGEADYTPDLPKVIVDYWGQPIHYYRRAYPEGALTQSYRAGIDYNGDSNINKLDQPTLSDFFCLRPYEVGPNSATDSRFDDDHPAFPDDTTTSFALETGSFALFSRGPDRDFTQNVRYDVNTGFPTSELNADNIVEVSP